MHDALAFSHFLAQAPRLEALYLARTRAVQWSGATSGTVELLASLDLTNWITEQHLLACA